MCDIRLRIRLYTVGHASVATIRNKTSNKLLSQRYTYCLHTSRLAQKRFSKNEGSKER